MKTKTKLPPLAKLTSGWLLFNLFLIMIGCSIFGSLLTEILGVSLPDEAEAYSSMSENSLDLGSFIIHACVSLLPALLFIHLYHKYPSFWLGLRTRNDLVSFLIVTILTFLVIPFEDFAGGINGLIISQEDESYIIIGAFFKNRDVFGIVKGFFLVSIMAGVGEELLMRGVIQKLIFKKSNSVHIAVWITAILFSLMHFNSSAILPLIISGAFLGYLYAWTKNIWLPIFSHALNNAYATVDAFWLGNENPSYDIGDIGNISTAIGGLVLTIIGLLIIKKRYAGDFDLKALFNRKAA